MRVRDQHGPLGKRDRARGTPNALRVPMVDSSVRALERRFQATHSLEDELAWLNARVRAGQRLEWAAYARLAELAPGDAAVYVEGLVKQGVVEPARLGLAACSGHVPARIAQRWVVTEPVGDEGLDMVRFWVRSHETDALSFELVLCVVVHVVERAAASGAWTASERDAALEALDDCSPGSSWSFRTRDQLERELARSGSARGRAAKVRDATCRAVMRLGGNRPGSGGLARALEAAEEAAAALSDPPRWGDVVARVLVEPRPAPPSPTVVVSRDGFVKFTCLPSREHAFERLGATKAFLLSSRECGLAFEAGKVCMGTFFGAMRKLFGRPHDIHDDWKQSISYYLDVDVDPGKRGHAGLSPVQLLLRVADWKGDLELQLRMPRRGGPDSRDLLEDGSDLLPAELRVHVLGFLLGYVEGLASSGVPLGDFEREYVYGEQKGLRYGVRGGVPFDEARKSASS
jgi:hypothetical protein